MAKNGKRMKAILGSYDLVKSYSFKDAIGILKASPVVKFDQTVDISFKLGVDPKKSDQQVRGAVFLPHGTGKVVKILVFASGDKAVEAINAGADYAGSTDLLEKIKGGWTDFDVVVSTPEMMREVGKLGKILGPRGLMPTPKAGSVTNDVVKAIEELRKGKIEFKLDRSAVCNSGIGKLSFSEESLVDNARAIVNALSRAKPATAKGLYFVSCTMSSTMGAGIRIDLKEILAS